MVEKRPGIHRNLRPAGSGIRHVRSFVRHANNGPAGSLQLLNFPISYLLLGKGYAPETTMYVAICLSLGCLFARLWFLHRQVEISIKSYFTQVLLNVCVVAVLAAIYPIIVSHLMNAGILRLFVVSGVCAIATLIVIYYVGLSVQERIFVQKKIVARIKQKCSA